MKIIDTSNYLEISEVLILDISEVVI